MGLLYEMVIKKKQSLRNKHESRLASESIKKGTAGAAMESRAARALATRLAATQPLIES